MMSERKPADPFLGRTVTDTITGYTGTATARIEFLTGCIQYCVTARIDRDGKLPDPVYFDESRLSIVDPVVAPLPPRMGVGGDMGRETPKSRA